MRAPRLTGWTGTRTLLSSDDHSDGVVAGPVEQPPGAGRRDSETAVRGRLSQLADVARLAGVDGVPEAVVEEKAIGHVAVVGPGVVAPPPSRDLELPQMVVGLLRMVVERGVVVGNCAADRSAQELLAILEGNEVLPPLAVGEIDEDDLSRRRLLRLFQNDWRRSDSYYRSFRMLRSLLFRCHCRNDHGRRDHHLPWWRKRFDALAAHDQAGQAKRKHYSHRALLLADAECPADLRLQAVVGIVVALEGGVVAALSAVKAVDRILEHCPEAAREIAHTLDTLDVIELI